MTLKTPVPMQAAGGDPIINYSALDLRALLRGLFALEGIIAPGVAAGAMKVSQRGAGANFSVDIAVGACAIQGDDVADQGPYVCTSTAVENRTIPSPPVSGTRVHRVVARVKDKLHNGTWTTYEWTLEVLEDTGSGTPATPASAISLATVSVSAGQASVLDGHITDTRQSAGLITPRLAQVGSDSARPPNPFESEAWWRTDSKLPEVWNGSAHRVIPLVPGPDLFVRKTANTNRSSTSTPTADPHLTLALEANATYLIEGFWIYQSASASTELQTSFAIPSGATLTWVPLGLTPSDAEQNFGQFAGHFRAPATTGTSARQTGTQPGNQLVMVPRGIIRTAGSAGSLTLQWAQGNSTAENTTLFADSYLAARRVA